MAGSPPRSDDMYADRTEAFARSGVTRPPLGVVVNVLDAQASPATYRFKSGVKVLGSDRSCDVVIADRTVSRRHVELELVPEGVAVRDLDSRNGVRYLGQQIGQMTLALGGRIRIGRVSVSIDVDTDAFEEQLTLSSKESYGAMVGRSPAMRRVFAILSRLEGSLVPVLIEGESGVGKELIAGALHEGSSVSSRQLVVVNCGAVAKELVASELFGHRKGAFTGAHDDRQGAFDRANGGTLFLDEVGELPLEVQPMLLRALESGDVQPVGADSVRRVKVRIVAATNRDLEEEVQAGRFRRDLFYRLAVVRVRVPPLRQRPEDIDVLARRFGRAAGLDDIPPEVLDQLRARRWLGNARELRNAIEAYAVLGVLPQHARSEDAELDAVLSERVDLQRCYGDQKEALVDRFTKTYLQQLLSHTRGNQTAAAEMAGLTRTYLGRLLGKYGLSVKGFRGERS